MFLRYNLVSFVWALFILVLCLAPQSELPDISLWEFLTFDKIVHAGLFAIQVLLIIIGLKRQYSSYRLRYYARSLAIIFGAAYGLFIEFLQLITDTGRTFDWLDFAADIIGCLLGLMLFRIIYGKEFAY